MFIQSQSNLTKVATTATAITSIEPKRMVSSFTMSFFMTLRSVFVASRFSTSWACSEARISACFSGIPASVNFLTKLWVSNKMVLIGLCLLIGFSSFSYANDTPNGWRWYNEPVKVKRKPKAAPPVAPTQGATLTRTLTAKEQMDWFRQEHEEVAAQAFIDPKNDEKVERVMYFNKYALDQSGVFGMTFTKVLHNNPELNYLKDHPAEQAARKDYLNEVRNKHIDSLQQLVNEGWGMFFVYNGQDTLSQRLAPSLQDFSAQYGIELLGISKDGTLIEAIASNEYDSKGKVDVPFVPAVMLVNPSTQEMKPLSYGFISMDKLMQRFHYVATNYQDFDY